ncbi:MAG: hypothetical protein Q9198_009904 [Flavoplaca austrocitrina]
MGAPTAWNAPDSKVAQSAAAPPPPPATASPSTKSLKTKPFSTKPTTTTKKMIPTSPQSKAPRAARIGNPIPMPPSATPLHATNPSTCSNGATTAVIAATSSAIPIASTKSRSTTMQNSTPKVRLAERVSIVGIGIVCGERSGVRGIIA